MQPDKINNQLKSKLSSPWLKLGILIVIIAFFVIVIYHLDINSFDISIDKIQSKIKSYGVWGPLVFILIYQVRVLLLIPISVISTLAGAIWGLTGLIYTLIALSICVTTEFFITRFLARDIVKKILKGKMDYLNKFIKKNAFGTVFLLRLIPNIILDVQNMGLALTKVRFKEYFPATMLGLLPGTFVLVYFGDSLIRTIVQPQYFWRIVLSLTFILCIYLAQGYLRKKFGFKQKGNSYENNNDDQHIYADCRRS